MDLGLDEPLAEGEAARPAKARAVGQAPKERTAEERKIMMAMARLSLGNALQIRIMRSILICCIRVPSTSELVTTVRDMTSKYTERAKALRGQGVGGDTVKSRLGLPHIHAWNGILGYVVKATEGVDKWKELRAKILEFIGAWKDKGWKGQWLMVKHVKLSKMFDRSTLRLEVQTTPLAQSQVQSEGLPTTQAFEIWPLVKSFILAQESHVEMEGMAPRGDLEQQIQAYIDRETGQS